MEHKYINISKENIDAEHTCCPFSDKKCKVSYDPQKEGLKKELDN